MAQKGTFAHTEAVSNRYGARVYKRPQTKVENYESFDQLDGRHPWQKMAPEACVLYKVRELGYGEISYFNFDLAREMGLIDEKHPNQMNKGLQKKILSTFSLRIINEYDLLNKKEYNSSKIKPHMYMATRYLQLQHASKTGLTSGDGRAIWNGQVKYKGQVWDVSSRGTGVTCLAPGIVEAGVPLETGNTEHGYGCGTADLDELYGEAIMAEIFHRQGIYTERVLTIIDLGNNIGIGVRVASSLIRPAHIFSFLKQEAWAPSKRSFDFLIEQHIKNKVWKISSQDPRKYDKALEELARSFARFSARIDSDYIFVWMAWDGDNILANGGIIDYGSVRQFGLKHDEYKYDDVDRFSTNLKTQKTQARYTVQSFAQLVDFIKKKKKSPIKKFKNHKVLKLFDELYQHYYQQHTLYKLGFTSQQTNILLNKHKRLVTQLLHTLKLLESKKTKRKMEKLPDGINKPAILNVRDLCRELPFTLIKNELMPLTSFELHNLALASTASRKDSRLTKTLSRQLLRFQNLFLKSVELVSTNQHPIELMASLAERSQKINRRDRITGNSVECIVQEIINFEKKGLPKNEVQKFIDLFVSYQSQYPDTIGFNRITVLDHTKTKALFEKALDYLEDFREDV